MNFNSFPHPCTVIDVLSDVGDPVFVNMFVDMSIIGVRDIVVIDSLMTITVRFGVVMLANVEITVLITSDVAAPLPYGVGVVADAWDGTFINVGLLSGERVDVLADVGTALEFITPST